MTKYPWETIGVAGTNPTQAAQSTDLRVASGVILRDHLVKSFGSCLGLSADPQPGEIELVSVIDGTNAGGKSPRGAIVQRNRHKVM